MSCQLSQDQIEKTIAFHGHSCPGLAIGIRAAEIALQEMNGVAQTDLVCVSETDMCGVDAIQYLTGCTYGKGNLIHRDYGKLAFSFYDRKNGQGIRLLFNRESRGARSGDFLDLMSKSGQGTLTAEEDIRLQQLRLNMQRLLMELPAEELFTVQSLAARPPRPPRVLNTMICEDCGEGTMESRTRRFAGKTLCIPCYDKVEQKI